jgi:hypothetical protein
VTDFHVMPVKDLVAHEDHDDCVCGPRCQAVSLPSGAVGWIVVHHALDGRR